MGFMKTIMDWVNDGASTPEENYTSEQEKKSEPNESYQDFSQNSLRDIKKTKFSDMNTERIQPFSVVVVRPQKYENATDIIDYLKSGKTVTLNFEQTDADVKRRMLDFLAGAVYALRADITKVSINACMLTPDGVEVSSELVDELVDELETTGAL